jgi:hypothetical protein
MSVGLSLSRSTAAASIELNDPSDFLCPGDTFDEEIPSRVLDRQIDGGQCYIHKDFEDPSGVDVPKALLDSPGVTPHRDFSDVEYKRWCIGLALAAKLESVGRDTLAGKLRNCHQDKSWRVCTGCGDRKPFYNRCDIFWCPQCSPRLAQRRLESLMWFVERMRQPKHIVLTIRNISNLTENFLRDAQRSLSRLRRTKLFRICRGGFWAMEITNKGRGWHVHFHLLADVPWLPVRDLSEAWKKANRQDSGVVWIECANKGGLRKNLPRYVTKYTSKGFSLHEWEASELAQFVNSIGKVRTFGVFGNLCGERSKHREWLKAIRGRRRPCECGCTTFKFYSAHELEWADQFTGWNRECPVIGPPVRERQMRWRLGLTE